MCQQGDIAWVYRPDPQGRNHKTRGHVIITDTDAVADNAILVGVAITGEFSDPLADNQIALPWSLPRHPVTGLRKPSVAVCNWLVTFSPDEIDNIGGRAPGGQLFQIMRQVKQVADDMNSANQ